jgi:hypothetical protein
MGAWLGRPRTESLQTLFFIGLALFGVFAFKGWALVFVGVFLAAAAWQLFAWRQFDR